MGVLRPELVMKSIVPIVMAGVLGIYGLIISVIISTGSASQIPPPATAQAPSVIPSNPRRATLFRAVCRSSR